MIDRRRFYISTGAIAVTQMLSRISRPNAANNAHGGELPGDLRRLTEPGGGDNVQPICPMAERFCSHPDAQADRRFGRSMPMAPSHDNFIQVRPTTMGESP